MKKIFLIIIITLSLASYFVFKKRVAKLGSMPQMPPSKIEVAAAQNYDLHEAIELIGNSYANESVEIAANIAEYISSIHFEDGAKIEQGDILVTLRQDEELSRLKAAKFQLAEHRRELARIKKLLDKQAVAQKLYDSRLTLINVTQQNIKEIEALLVDKTIRAPFSGRVGVRNISVGSLVKPDQIIVRIDDISKIKLDFHVPSDFIADLKIGGKIIATSPALGNREFVAEIASINNYIDDKTRTILVRAIIDNADEAIKAGLLMKVNIMRSTRYNIMVLDDAIIQKQNNHFVIVVDPETNIANYRPVEVGISKEGKTEIMTGLVAGEQVVIRGVNKAFPGQKVEIINKEPK